MHRCLLVAILGVACVSTVDAFAQSEVRIFHNFRAQPNDLMRRQFLVSSLPHLSPEDRVFAAQLLATVDTELGLYSEAIEDFPFDNRIALKTPPPEPNLLTPVPSSIGDFTSQAVDGGKIANPVKAIDAISALAIKHHVVLVNEAHHDVQTRELTLELLPRLRALGYNYFAAEALTESGDALLKRGYAIKSSGTEYLNEPIYGEIVREAIRLGYRIIAYDPVTDVVDRDSAQAETLYKLVLAHDPDAKIFIHAGYAHIDKSMGNLFNTRPMAMQLMELTHHDVFSIDQTQFHDDKLSLMESDRDRVYHNLVEQFRPHEPIVLKFIDNEKIWTSDKIKHDVSVILPEQGNGIRPNWLTLGGERHPWPISPALCLRDFPCVIEAYYADESNDAIPADRYTFLSPFGPSSLYLKVGAYRLRVWGIAGNAISEQRIEMTAEGTPFAFKAPTPPR